MSDQFSAVEAYRSALVTGDVDPVAAHLTDDVVVETNFGRAEGIEAALALLREPRTAGLLSSGARWSDPVTNGDSVTVTAVLPATAPFGGIEFAFVFAGAKISRAEHQTLPAAPIQAGPLRLTEQIENAVNGALDNGTPMLIAYTDESGEIHVSFRGTIQAYSGDQLALWARDPAGGLPRHIAGRPKVTLFYHDPGSRTSYTFYGRARVEGEPAARATIYENSPARERQADFRRRGVAIVVDLDKVEGRGPGGRVLMLRSVDGNG
jgi:SnoaL-like domain